MYDDKTPESIKNEILAGMPGMDTSEGSYIDTLISPIAYQIWKYYSALSAVEPILFVDETSGEYIDKRCADYGITRKPGTTATAAMTFTGDNGTVIPAGKIFMTADGLAFAMTESVTIADGSATGTVMSDDVGSQYNVGANAIVSQSIPLSGLTGWTNTAASGGTDVETDTALVARLYDRLQNPATSGNSAHYKAWAMETPGVGNCRVIPLWNGAGTVKLVIVDQDGAPASSTIVAACEDHVELVRPIGATVTVTAATAVSIAVSATLTLDGTVTLADVKSKFESALSDYLKSITFAKNEVLYSRIAFLIMDIDGVQDYASLTVNSGTANIELTNVQVPTKGVINFVTG